MIPMSPTTPTQPRHVHVWEPRWYPLDKQHVRRVCVLPGCHARQVKRVKA